MYLLFQTAGDFGGYVKEYGWPFVGLVIATLLIWRVLIPLVREQNERIIGMMKEQMDASNAQLEEARKTRTEEVAKFHKTMDEAIREYAANQNKVAQTLDGLVSEVRKKRDPRHQ